jgi:cystathionine beta-lyase
VDGVTAAPPAHDVFESLSLEELRARRSAKWAVYAPDVLPAWVAEMDFPLAPAVRDALAQAVERDDCGYPDRHAIREPFARFAEARFGWSVDPGRVWLLGDVMAGVTSLIAVLTEPGDGIVINPPVYPPFFAAIREAGRRVVEAPLRPDARWELDLDALEQAFAGGAAVYVLCNPHNPTGRVLARAELEAVAALAERYGVLVVSDEIHAPLVLPGATHVPYVTVSDEAAAHGITLASASKAWNIAGLKAAVAVAGSDAGVRRIASKLPESLPYHAGHLGVLASVAAFLDGGEWLDALLRRLDANRRLLGALLERMLPAVGYVEPEAGYLTWLDCRELGLGDDPAAAFLERGRVALSPGPTFGAQGRGFARLNVGTSSALVEEAVRRMASAVESA